MADDAFAVWRDALARVPEALQAKASKTKASAQLVELDRWIRKELPGLITSREPPHMKQPEVARLVEWKLARFTWRPRLLDFAKALDPVVVQAATQAALQKLLAQPAKAAAAAASGAGAGSSSSAGSGHKGGSGAKAGSGGGGGQGGEGPQQQPQAQQQAALQVPEDGALEAALAELTVLKGVGPATASAVLAAATAAEGPGGAAATVQPLPYMSDEAMAAAGCRKGDYSARAYLQVVHWAVETAGWLNSLQQQEKQERGSSWTARDVELACWAAARLELELTAKGSGKGAGTGAKKGRQGEAGKAGSAQGPAAKRLRK